MEAPQAKPVLPVCPHCGADPANFSTALLKLNPATTACAVYCANAGCRKLHSVQIMSMDVPQVVPANRIPPRVALAR